MATTTGEAVLAQGTRNGGFEETPGGAIRYNQIVVVYTEDNLTHLGYRSALRTLCMEPIYSEDIDAPLDEYDGCPKCRVIDGRLAVAMQRYLKMVKEARKRVFTS